VHPASFSVSLSTALHYRSCFWIFFRDGMAFRLQRYYFLCPVLPEYRYWNVHHLDVHSSSQSCWFFSLTLTKCNSSKSLILLPITMVHVVSVYYSLLLLWRAMNSGWCI
jgi:hypothetical protein